jgi:hypothetical protein
VPTPQLWQLAEPEALEYNPAAQPWQLSSDEPPLSLKYLPAPQGRQIVAPLRL